MRKPMVTRTFIGMEVTVLALDVETAEPTNVTVTLTRVYKDNKKLMKAVEEVVNTDTLKAAHIVDSKEIETCYGMSENDFIKYATILDPATRKAIETETETE